MRTLHMYLLHHTLEGHFVYSFSHFFFVFFCFVLFCYGLHTLHSHSHVLSNILYCMYTIYSYSSGFSPMENFSPLPFQGFYSPWAFSWSVQGHHRPKSVVFVVYICFGHIFHQSLLVLVFTGLLVVTLSLF